MNPSRSIAQVMAQGVEALRAADVPGAAGDARALMAHALGVGRDRITLLAHDPMPGDALVKWHEAIDRRVKREPVSHILGYRAFFGRDFKVGAEVLDPRPETEILVAEALKLPFENLLDLGTGSGAIALSLLAERPQAVAVASDVSGAALEMARINAGTLGVQDRVTWRESDWWQGIDGQFDLVVSNPPYIAEDEMPDLSPELLRYEPYGALSPGGDGLDAYRKIIRGLSKHLRPGGHALFEIGPTQGAAVMNLAQQAEFNGIDCIRDLDGRDRVIFLKTE